MPAGAWAPTSMAPSSTSPSGIATTGSAPTPSAGLLARHRRRGLQPAEVDRHRRLHHRRLDGGAGRHRHRRTCAAVGRARCPRRIRRRPPAHHPPRHQPARGPHVRRRPARHAHRRPHLHRTHPRLPRVPRQPGHRLGGDRVPPAGNGSHVRGTRAARRCPRRTAARMELHRRQHATSANGCCTSATRRWPNWAKWRRST